MDLRGTEKSVRGLVSSSSMAGGIGGHLVIRFVVLDSGGHSCLLSRRLQWGEWFRGSCVPLPYLLLACLLHGVVS